MTNILIITIRNAAVNKTDVAVLCKAIRDEAQNTKGQSATPHLRRACSDIQAIRNKTFHQAYKTVDAMRTAIQKLENICERFGDKETSTKVAALLSEAPPPFSSVPQPQNVLYQL